MNKTLRFIITLLILNGSSGFAKQHISEDTWQAVMPFLLPDNHPIKPKLDQIFSSRRVILNLKNMKKAGFINPKVRRWTHLIVTKHPDLPGYVIKTYLDAQRYFKNMREHDHWINRVKGAQAIRELLEAYGWNKWFKVPNKWIYVLPKHPAPSEDYQQKYFILVEEDMQLLSDEQNAAAWKSTLITEKKLEALYAILEQIGLRDCSKIHNIPFSEDGRIAFIDTETTNEWPISYGRLTQDLPETLRPFWRSLY